MVVPWFPANDVGSPHSELQSIIPDYAALVYLSSVCISRNPFYICAIRPREKGNAAQSHPGNSGDNGFCA